MKLTTIERQLLANVVTMILSSENLNPIWGCSGKIIGLVGQFVIEQFSCIRNFLIKHPHYSPHPPQISKIRLKTKKSHPSSLRPYTFSRFSTIMLCLIVFCTLQVRYQSTDLYSNKTLSLLILKQNTHSTLVSYKFSTSVPYLKCILQNQF